MECPKCKSKMIKRVNHTTKQEFWGCSNYPQCKGSRNLDGTIGRQDGGDDADDWERADAMGFSIYDFGDN